MQEYQIYFSLMCLATTILTFVVINLKNKLNKLEHQIKKLSK